MQTGSKGRKEYADRVIKIKSPNNEAYTKAVEDMAEQKKEVRSMVGIVIFTPIGMHNNCNLRARM